jgi:NAD(P)-dependent dehydrogenase (short-subunit alcohol dehydrogenase family)
MKEQDLNKLIHATPILDGLVHSAGILKILPFPFINREEFNGIMETNVLVPAFISQQLVKSKKMNKDSSVVFISSISGVMISTAGNSMYSTSKGAVNGLVKGMATDLASKKIRVNSIIAGMIETSIFKGSTITSEQFEEDMKRYPLKRYGKPEEVAWAVIYLLSDASAWVTGTNMLIDGGYTLL